MNPTRKVIYLILLLFVIWRPPCHSQSTSYRVQYSTTSPSVVYLASQSLNTRDGGTVLIGKWGLVSEDSSRVMMMKLDQYGNMAWCKMIRTGGLLEYFALCEMSDGSIAAAVDLGYYDGVTEWFDLSLFKISCGGNVLWNKRVNMSTPKKWLHPMSLRPGRDNDLLLSLYADIGQFSSVCRFDGNGNLVWSQTFTGPAILPNTSCYYSGSAFYSPDNTVLVFGLKNTFANAFNYSKQLYGLQLNYTDGTITKSASYNYNEFNTNDGVIVANAKTHFDAEALSDGTYALFGLFSNWNFQHAYTYRLIVNKDLSLGPAQTFDLPYALAIDHVVKMTVLPNGESHMTTQNYDDATDYWYAVDRSFNTIRQVKIPTVGEQVFGGNVVTQTGAARSTFLNDGYRWATSQHYIEPTQVENGSAKILPCLGSDTSYAHVNTNPWVVSAGAWNWVSTAAGQVVVTDLPYTVADIPVTTTYSCSPDQPVMDFKIVGEGVVCSTAAAPSSFHITTHDPDNKPVQWALDPALYQRLQTPNDSTVLITFNSPAGGPSTGKLYASGGDCLPVKDSLTITLYPDAQLPRYLTLCRDPVTLHPGYWFRSYQWQDGSTDSVYTINRAGRYILQLETWCGGHLTDTVDVFSDKIGTFGKPAICEHDTLTLTAPDGFLNESWGPDYNLISVRQGVVDVYPGKDTFYILSSLTPDGCSLKDTVYIKVRKAPVVNLGPDTVVCQQEKLVLYAGPAMQRYSWSTGDTSSSITVSAAGLYAVEVTDAYGCHGGDTIAVQEKYCVDRIMWPNAFTPDGNGVNDVFRPRLQGALDEYDLVIYNRWGQVVFRSKDPSAGWDGGRKPGGTYVWMCRYKFSDAGRKVEKGTVELIR